ncbi:MAG TPA: DMT family transporter [Anaerolineales bacterium]|nr:DMT family transporter [Anaerolineales bacterium]
MTAIVFGLLSAASWGAGDFIGGFASRKLSAFLVVIVSQASGLIMLIGAVLIFAEPIPAGRDLFIGAAAGISGVIGLLALYQGMAVGRIGVVAPLSAVVTAIVPVVFGMLLEGWPGSKVVVGFVFALIAVWLVSQGEEDDIQPGVKIGSTALRYALVAGLGFGVFFILLDQISTGAVYWPIVAARSASITFVSLVVFLRSSWRSPSSVAFGKITALILFGGILDAGGNVFFALATQAGRLDISSVLASLYPAGTVFLAWLILRERLAWLQWLGVVAALIAVGLVAG